MKSKIFILTALFSSFSFASDIDYTRCNSASGLYGMSINNDGELSVAVGQKIIKKETKGNVEKYVIQNDPQTFGGLGSPTQIEVSFEKDDHGKITKVITGPDKLNQEQIEKMNQIQLDFQVSSSVMGADWTFGNSQIFGGPYGIPNTTMTQEPQFYVKDKNDGYKYKKLSQLSKSERKNVGYTEELYQEMKSKAKRDKRSVGRIKKGLKSIQENSNPVFYMGSQAEFIFKDGICYPNKVSTRMFHTQDKSVNLNETFSKNNCQKVAILHKKHYDEVNKCTKALDQIGQETILKSINLNSYPAMAVGLGGYGGMGYSSSVFLQLKAQQRLCSDIFGDLLSGDSKKQQDKRPSVIHK